MSQAAEAQHPLLTALEAGRMPEVFGHAEHVQAAWLYVRSFPLHEAVGRCCRALKTLADGAGVPDKYHETLTWAFVLLTAERALEPDAPSDWPSFIERHPELLAWKPGLVERYYRPQTLWSDRARNTFLLPDAGIEPERTWQTDGVPEHALLPDEPVHAGGGA